VKKNRINGAVEPGVEPTGGQDEANKKPEAPKEPERKVLTTEERLAFMLYATQQQLRAVKQHNAALMKQNADLAQENSRLNEALTGQENQQTTVAMVDLEKDYEFLKNPHVLVHDTKTDEYFLKPVQ